MSTSILAPQTKNTENTNAQTTSDLKTEQEINREVRGFALYVGATEAQLAAADTSIAELITELKARLTQLAPDADNYATLAIAPEGIGGRDIDVARFALHEPAARAAKKRQKAAAQAADRAASGVTVDLGRKRVLLDNIAAPLTYKEFELLQFFVLREGQTITREDIIETLWKGYPAAETPNERTIDVHVRRLRVKLEKYQDIIRTVRGAGYRFDRHADVRIIAGLAPSPDLI